MTINLDRKELARDRIRRLFEYMAAVQRLSTPPKLHLDEYPMVIRVRDLPDHPSITMGTLPLRGDPNAEGADFVLKVSRPTETPCPAIPTCLVGWLKSGWEKPSGELRNHEKRKVTNKNGSTTQAKFADNPERPAALAKYAKLRNGWLASQEQTHRATELFEQLLETWGRLERESERVELVYGDAVFHHVNGKDTVEHPLFVHEMSLEFDADVPEFVLRESDQLPQLYSALLHWAQLDNETIMVARKLFQTAEGPQRYSDVISAIWPDSPLLASADEMTMPELATGPQIVTDPVIYLGTRSQGFMQAIESFLEELPTLQELPPSLVRVVGLEPSEEDPTPAPTDILYTMPANPEQERVAVRLARSGCVLVQGPPGTGKTHTIANLISHLLAEGKSILVTSQRTKALRVLRDFIVPQLRPLCVSVLDHENESRAQLEEAVKGMVARFSASESEELTALAQTFRDRRFRIKRDLQDAERRLMDARTDEYRPLEIEGESIHPTKAAHRLAEGRGQHDWIAGPVSGPLPLNPDELTQLYSLAEEAPEKGAELPPVEKLLSAGQLRELIDELKKLRKAGEQFPETFWSHTEPTLEQLENLRKAGRAAATALRKREEWQMECIRAGIMGGEHRQAWEDFVEMIEATHRDIAPLERQVMAVGPTITSDMAPAQQLEAVEAVVVHLKAGKSVNYLHILTKPAWKKALESIRVEGGAPRTLEHLEAVAALIRIRIRREALNKRWERQMTEKGAIPPKDLGSRPEDTALQYVERIRHNLSWSITTWPAFEAAVKECGLQWNHVLELAAPNANAAGELLRMREALEDHLEPVVESRMATIQGRAMEEQRKSVLTFLAGYAGHDDGGQVSADLRQGILNDDVEGYAQALHRLVTLHQRTASVGRRDEILNRLQEVAPNWAAAVRERTPPHDRGQVPGDAAMAWRYRQLFDALQVRTEPHLDELQQDVVRLRDKLQEATANYVENLTWAAQLKRTGVRQQQALIGWLDLMRKIGSGKGKRAPQLKAKARERLSECQESVPVWIMPLSRVAESYHPGKAKFDVVILDEASQSDIMGLIAFALGREVVVVGDHEQVSPDAIGQSYADIEQLIEAYLQDIPNRELYDLKTSVYDLARQSFGGTIRLLEHFRSVPEIVAFSNHLCYEGEIQPLRESSRVKLRPATVPIRVGGAVDRKVNQREVEEVAALLIACCEQPEYSYASMGVVSLVGEEQAVAIDRLITKHLDLSQYQQRKIVCGTPPQFQGDERDVMFLSMVDAPSDLGPLAIRATDMFIKRFNVAASRARDQVWLVHSLDPRTDLKEGDLRERLIRHVVDPGVRPRGRRRNIAPARFEYEFQEQIYDHLKGLGYEVMVDMPIGSYKLDLVVEGLEGRVAIQCDGEREYAPQKLDQDIHRETVLDRLGWKIVRLRASQFHLHPEESLRHLVEMLQAEGVQPLPPESEATESADGHTELSRRVIARAAELRRRWKQIEERGEIEEEEEELEEDGEIPAAETPTSKPREFGGWDAPLEGLAPFGLVSAGGPRLLEPDNGEPVMAPPAFAAAQPEAPAATPPVGNGNPPSEATPAPQPATSASGRHIRRLVGAKQRRPKDDPSAS